MTSNNRKPSKKQQTVSRTCAVFLIGEIEAVELLVTHLAGRHARAVAAHELIVRAN